MKYKTALFATLAAFSLTACGDPFLSNTEDKTRDVGFGFNIDSGDLANLTSGIWVDPHGCDHWIIDDGKEGYLSARLGDNGKPVCSGTGVPNNVTGPYNDGKSE
jgi:hypothetical protein